MATDPEELDPELDVELGGDDEAIDEELEGALPDGFSVEGEDEDDAVAAVDDEDVDEVVVAPVLAAEEAETDDFE